MTHICELNDNKHQHRSDILDALFSPNISLRYDGNPMESSDTSPPTGRNLQSQPKSQLPFRWTWAWYLILNAITTATTSMELMHIGYFKQQLHVIIIGSMSPSFSSENSARHQSLSAFTGIPIDGHGTKLCTTARKRIIGNYRHVEKHRRNGRVSPSTEYTWRTVSVWLCAPFYCCFFVYLPARTKPLLSFHKRLW